MIDIITKLSYLHGLQAIPLEKNNILDERMVHDELEQLTA